METPIPNHDSIKETIEASVNESIDNSNQTEDKPTNGSVDQNQQSSSPMEIDTKEDSTKPEINTPTPNENSQLPMHEIVGGSSVRRYLNQHLTKTLLEGLKEVAQIKPEDPLKYLGEFLISKSNESKKE
ncbi:COMPASS/SET1C histone methyltransferase complex subunit, putative [Candida dubliniensis CD36]|uniref:COMPASS/SET1C histone methyltransferase complex subunit, putative n=1 Tax=Candida dubliniensis (strain CD36 / ATCC MYA-646 / CBS 7987 / NCPF 3949 / NRRL Y-17841) TaxID=573826 RepID=B9WHW9_CANDC|nr:COMPASS/SET1C histone methyltransferase complex subunit, putative [Candida dubliniensis CD36]CAX41764.1 COMPASS/SET1C histone methyltransferase complex subunit, putative [Candida dubliniensis CD36]